MPKQYPTPNLDELLKKVSPGLFHPHVESPIREAVAKDIALAFESLIPPRAEWKCPECSATHENDPGFNCECEGDETDDHGYTLDCKCYNAVCYSCGTVRSPPKLFYVNKV